MNEKNFEAANEAYEWLKAAGLPVSIPAIEEEFGIEKGKFHNWRSNRKRLKSALTEAIFALAPVSSQDGDVQRWALDDISMHGNIRTEFGLEELQSLANSLRSTTLLQYPLGYVGEREGRPHLFLCVGERRLRAHELRRDRGEEVDSMLVRVIAEPTQKEFLRMNFVENFQRVDLRPSEEAAGIQQMLDLVDEGTGLAPFNVMTCAEELGMRPQRVIDAVNSLSAPAKARKVLDEGRVAFDVVGQIGGLPEGMREQAAEEILFGPAGPMRQKEARAWIANNYRRDLRKADFDKEDGELTPAGACTGCRWYGANRDDLGGPSAQYQCLNPRCFLEKQAAVAERERARILEEGGDVVLMSEEDSAKIFDGVDGRLAPNCGFVSLETRPLPYYLEDGDRNRGSAPKWRDAVGDDCPTVYVAWDKSGKRVDLIETGPAMVAAINGAYSTLFRAKAAEGLLSSEEETLQRNIKAAMEREGRAVCVEGARELYGKLHNTPGCFERGMTRSLVVLAAEQGLKPDDYHFLCEMLEPGMAKAKATHRGFLELMDLKCADVEELLALLAILLQVRSLRYHGFEPWCEEGPMADLCAEVGFAPAEWWKKLKRRKGAAEREARKAGEQEAEGSGPLADEEEAV